MVVSGKLITFVPRFCNFTFKIMNSIESAKGEIVMYQPDETIRLEVRMGEDTVWLSQQQMAELFQRDQSVIARHIRNIYKEEELTEEGTYAKFAYMGHDGLQKYEVFPDYRRCGLSVWCKPERCWQETLCLYPNARDCACRSSEHDKIKTPFVALQDRRDRPLISPNGQSPCDFSLFHIFLFPNAQFHFIHANDISGLNV